MKRNKLAILTIALLVLGMEVDAQDHEYNLDETYSLGENGTIHLHSNDAEVNIRGTDRSDVHLVVYRYVDVDGWEIKSEDNFKMVVENRNGDLHIRENNDENGRFVVGNVRKEYRITIEAPRQAALDIRGDDDKYEIFGFDAAVKLNADDAEINLGELTGDDFEFDIDDGTINLDQGQGKMKLNMDDGELFVRQADFTEIDARSDDGTIDITTSLSGNGFYRFDMDDGNVRLNVSGGGGEFDIRHDDPSVRVDPDFEDIRSDEEYSVYRLAGGEAKIDIYSDDGNIELRTI